MTQEDQIIDTENRLLTAMKTGNIYTLDELLHDDLIFNVPTGQTITKQIDIENYRSGIMTVHDIEISDQIINIMDDVSIVVVTFHLKANYADQIIDGTYRYLRVWKLLGKSWKVIAGSGTHIREYNH
jgi:ketosteroid isomerase-like protein